MIILGMSIMRLSSAAEFLAATENLRALDPYRTNLIGSVALSIATGSRTYDEYFWWTISNGEGEIESLAMRTAPHNLVLIPMNDEAATELAWHVARVDPHLPGVSGPAKTVESFVAAWMSLTKNALQLSSEELLYTLPLLAPFAVPGKMRKAEIEDLELVTQWTKNFAVEAGLDMPHLESSVLTSLSEGRSFLWEADNRPVALAGHAPLVSTPSGVVGRIGPVFTPPEFRRNGYAGSLTSALSQQLIDQGSFVMLYTDASNETSNGVYQRIGFELLDRNKSFTLVK